MEGFRVFVGFYNCSLGSIVFNKEDSFGLSGLTKKQQGARKWEGVFTHRNFAIIIILGVGSIKISLHKMV
jgi:hypothetical protein